MGIRSDESSTWTNNSGPDPVFLNSLVPEGHEVIQVTKEHALVVDLDAFMWVRVHDGRWVNLRGGRVSEYSECHWVFGILVKKDSET